MLCGKVDSSGIIIVKPCNNMINLGFPIPALQGKNLSVYLLCFTQDAKQTDTPCAETFLGVAKYWTGFSTGMWNWNMGLDRWT